MNIQVEHHRGAWRLILLLAGIVIPVYGYSHELSGTYARILSMHFSDDISASGLRTEGGGKYSRWTVPWHSECLYDTGMVCSGVYLRGSYIDLKGDVDDGAVVHWRSYGTLVGTDVTVRLSEHVSVRGGLGVGYARVRNMSRGMEGDENYEEVLGWERKNALIVSPEISSTITSGNFTLSPGLSFLSLREFSSSRHDIGSHAGSYSVRMTYTFRDVFRVMGRGSDVIVENNTGGFYGPGWKEDLGFSLVNETQLLFSIPFCVGGHVFSLRAGPGFIKGNGGARGGSFSFGLKT
ncbi:TPA: hypothetical protein ACG30L_005115 [Escherichia coli]|nr:hypothetical protein [Escherichia coli]